MYTATRQAVFDVCSEKSVPDSVWHTLCSLLGVHFVECNLIELDFWVIGSVIFEFFFACEKFYKFVEVIGSVCVEH